MKAVLPIRRTLPGKTAGSARSSEHDAHQSRDPDALTRRSESPAALLRLAVVDRTLEQASARGHSLSHGFIVRRSSSRGASRCSARRRSTTDARPRVPLRPGRARATFRTVRWSKDLAVPRTVELGIPCRAGRRERARSHGLLGRSFVSRPDAVVARAVSPRPQPCLGGPATSGSGRLGAGMRQLHPGEPTFSRLRVVAYYPGTTTSSPTARALVDRSYGRTHAARRRRMSGTSAPRRHDCIPESPPVLLAAPACEATAAFALLSTLARSSATEFTATFNDFRMWTCSRARRFRAVHGLRRLNTVKSRHPAGISASSSNYRRYRTDRALR